MLKKLLYALVLVAAACRSKPKPEEDQILLETPDKELDGESLTVDSLPPLNL